MVLGMQRRMPAQTLLCTQVDKPAVEAIDAPLRAEPQAADPVHEAAPVDVAAHGPEPAGGQAGDGHAEEVCSIETPKAGGDRGTTDPNINPEHPTPGHESAAEEYNTASEGGDLDAAAAAPAIDGAEIEAIKEEVLCTGQKRYHHLLSVCLLSQLGCYQSSDPTDWRLQSGPSLRELTAMVPVCSDVPALSKCMRTLLADVNAVSAELPVCGASADRGGGGCAGHFGSRRARARGAVPPHLSNFWGHEDNLGKSVHDISIHIYDAIHMRRRR